MHNFKIFFIVCLAGLASCEMFPEYVGLPVPPKADEATLKKAIFKVSRSAQGECDDQDNEPQVREALNHLTARLLDITPDRSATEKLPQVVGVWQQVWSDSRFTSIPGACFEADKIFQVVFEDGFYYNIAEINFPDQTFVSFTRGTYVVKDSSLSVSFTDNISVIGTLDDFPDLTEAARQVENGEIEPDLTRPTGGENLTLINLYVDDHLRIVGNDPTPSQANELFVLERVDR